MHGAILFFFQLRDLQIELRKAPANYQRQVSNRVVHYKADLASLRRQISSGASLREELFSKQQEEDDVSTSLHIVFRMFMALEKKKRKVAFYDL